MSQRSDIDRVLHVWMTDGPTAIPDRVVDVIATRIAVQRQRRLWPFPGRTNVTTQIKLIAALAAAVVVAVVGYNLLPGTTGPGAPTTAPTTAPTSTAPATVAPSVGAVFPTWWSSDGPPTGAGILAPGSQTTRSFRPGFTFSVPDGWVNDGDEAGFFSLFADTPANQAEFARSGDLAHSIIMGPRSNPYFICEAWEGSSGATAAEVVAAMVDNEALAASEPIDVAIGGLTGKQVDVQLDPGWTESCPGDPPTFDIADMRSRGILLDTADRGLIVIFVGSLHSADHEAFLAEAMPIIETIQFDIEP